MDGYFANSDSLARLAAQDDPFGGALGAANLTEVIGFLDDADEVNRDWAAFMLALSGPDTKQVHDALLRAADDEAEIVRAEAIWGLAQRDKARALPLIKRELRSDSVTVPLLEAAELVADASLTELLEPFTKPSADKFLDDTALAAFHACKAAL